MVWHSHIRLWLAFDDGMSLISSSYASVQKSISMQVDTPLWWQYNFTFEANLLSLKQKALTAVDKGFKRLRTAITFLSTADLRDAADAFGVKPRARVLESDEESESDDDHVDAASVYGEEDEDVEPGPSKATRPIILRKLHGTSRK